MSFKQVVFILLAVLCLVGAFYVWNLPAQTQLHSTPKSMTITLGKLSKEYNLEKLAHSFTSLDINVVSPAYGHLNVTSKGITKINYKAVPFLDVIQEFLDQIPGKEKPNYKMVITCYDGYQPVLNLNIFDKGTPYLAFQQNNIYTQLPISNEGKWNLVDMAQGEGEPNHLSPAPFYLVWDTVESYPTGWPFGIQKIEFVKK